MPVEFFFFRQKLVNCHAKQCVSAKAASVLANSQLASYKVVYFLMSVKSRTQKV